MLSDISGMPAFWHQPKQPQLGVRETGRGANLSERQAIASEAKIGDV